jgi:hypothetical protein
MTEKAFSNNLRRGLGSAIIELKENPNRARYRDIVLRYCLRDIAYDTQVEGTKGYYLYTAIQTFDNPGVFLNKIAEKFEGRHYWRLSEQLYDILCCFSNDGYKTADEALEKKYSDLKTRLPKMRNYNLGLCEREQLENLMIRKLDSGFKAFKLCIHDIGEMIAKRGNCDCLWCDSLFANAKDKFGEERVNSFIDEMCKKSEAVKLLIDTLKAEELSCNEYQANLLTESPTVDVLLQYAREAAKNENPRSQMPRLRHLFAKKASEAEFLELAHTVLREDDETVKALLLMMFWRRPFPLDIAPLIEYTKSNNELLTEMAIDKLGYVKDKRIHDLAIHLLEEKGLDSLTLSLLKKNYRKTDDGIICKLIAKASNVPQYVQGDIVDIYTHHGSANALPILLHVYHKGYCTHCRYGIVQAMNHCKVLSDGIIEECLYDSYEDTRKMAKKRKRQKERQKII